MYHSLFLCLLFAAQCTTSAWAATINWSASTNHGLSQADGSELPVGSLVRLGYFRSVMTDQPLTDGEIKAIAGSITLLEANFVQVAATTIGSGFSGSVAGHFAASSTADTSATGLNVEGKQMFVWVMNAVTSGAATQQAILYWSLADTLTNPDATPDVPGARWKFPVQDPPGMTTVDLTDLTAGTGSLAAGARVVLGSYPNGTSSTTSVANFALAVIIPMPVVGTAAQIVGGIVSTPYSLTFSVTGGAAPYKWEVTSGTMPNGLALSELGVLSGVPTTAGSYAFTVRVTDGGAMVSTKAITMVIADNVLAITTSSPLSNGQEGSSLSQQLSAAGGTAPYSWSLSGGSLPSGLTLVNGLISGTPLASGTFDFEVRLTDGGMLTATQTYALTLTASSLSINTSYVPAPVVGYAYSQSLVGTGGTGTYAWSIVGGSLPAGLSLSTGGLVGGTPTTVTSGLECIVKLMDSVGVTRTKSLFFTTLSKLPLPTVQAPGFADTIVAGDFSHTLSATHFPRKFTVSGLPAGLGYKSTTGEISGRPTVAGTFVVRITATNTMGTSAAISAVLRVRALPVGVVGTFIALVERETSANSLTNGLGGRVDVTTAATGNYTAKLSIAGVTRTFNGVLIAQVSGVVTLEANFPRSGALPSCSMSLLFAPPSNTISGEVSMVVETTTYHSLVTGWRQTWNTSTNPASERAGYYTAAVDLAAPAGATIPQGTGYLSFTLGQAGTITMSGKAADGSSFATASLVGPSGELLVYQSLYANKGSIKGVVVLSAAVDGLFTDNTVSGSLAWMKPDDSARAYEAGFGPLSLTVTGKYMAPASRGYVVLGLPSPGTLTLRFAEGGLSAAAINPTMNEAQFTDALKVIMPAKDSNDNPAGATLSINPATGAVSGTFSLLDGTLPRKVTYQGTIVRTASASSYAVGYFLLPQIPTLTEKITTSPILSGQMTLED